MEQISNLAYVHPDAKIGSDVIIDAFAFIDKNVEIGDGCHIHPHVSILSGARIGENNEIFENAIISATPQDFRWKGKDSYVKLGDNNKIREQVIINRGMREESSTTIGNNTFIFAQTHIGHDSEIGNNCVIGNAVKIAGYVKIGNHSILSSNALVHEKNHVGEWVLIKGGCRINGNVPPFAVMAHNPIVYFGVNSYVLKRAAKKDDVINDIAKCYHHIYLSGTSLFNALNRIKDDVEPSAERDSIINFIEGHSLKLAGLPLSDEYDY